MTPFTLLLHARDHLWRMRDLPLDVRREGCAVLWRLALQALTPDEIERLKGVAPLSKEKRTSCNRHNNCSEKTPGSSCCFDEGCEDCFGS